MRIIAILLLVLSFSGCSDDFGVASFCDDLVLESENELADYVNDILSDLEPFPTFSDPLGHEDNLLFLVDELNRRNDCLVASVLCYACIKTFPLQSELIVEVEDAGFVTAKIIDIATPEIGEMYFEGIHNP